LAIQGVAIYVQQIFYGGALIVAVVGSRILITRGATRRVSQVDTGTPGTAGAHTGAPEAEAV
jgi:hypothetical protein